MTLEEKTGEHLNADLISASRVKGTAVYDMSGDRIGTVDDIMLSKRHGDVAYAVMSFGGFLGIGERYHALPLDSLDYDTRLEGYRVGAEGEAFRDAPNYSRADLDDDDMWLEETDAYYADATSRGELRRRGLTDPSVGIPGGYGATHSERELDIKASGLTSEAVQTNRY